MYYIILYYNYNINYIILYYIILYYIILYYIILYYIIIILLYHIIWGSDRVNSLRVWDGCRRRHLSCIDDVRPSSKFILFACICYTYHRCIYEFNMNCLFVHLLTNVCIYMKQFYRWDMILCVHICVPVVRVICVWVCLNGIWSRWKVLNMQLLACSCKEHEFARMYINDKNS